MKHYVCGFLFNVEADPIQVMLIRKNRPTFQVGKANGIGGHIESGETPIQAMVREFKEEADLLILDWEKDSILTGKDFEVHFFHAMAGHAEFSAARSMTDEKIEIHSVDNVRRINPVNNLPFLVNLALDKSGIARPVNLLDISNTKNNDDPSP
jgi:8-oxo-dGTP pyrophosphatase MutT (NUDIX family)